MAPDPEEANRQMTRAIAHLFVAHPRAVDLHSDVLWDPPPHLTDAERALKRSMSGLTLHHLADCGIFEGSLSEHDGYVVVTGAQLTTAGYLLGQVSLAAVETDDTKLAALVARRVNSKH